MILRYWGVRTSKLLRRRCKHVIQSGFEFGEASVVFGIENRERVFDGDMLDIVETCIFLVLAEIVAQNEDALGVWTVGEREL